MTSLMQEYRDKIGRLVNATAEGKINWKKQDSITYCFEMLNETGEEILTSIQNDKFRYRLTIINVSRNETVVSMNSFSHPSFNKFLIGLYRAASNYLDRRGLDLLGDMLNKI